jgi:hypothetical protein
MMDFARAMDELRNGNVVKRKGWNGKGMYLFLVKEWMDQELGIDTDTSYATFVAIKTTDNKIVPWTASQSDIFATDWIGSDR